MAMTRRLTAGQERALALLAESEGVSKHKAVVRAITETAARHVRDDRVRALSRDGRALCRVVASPRPVSIEHPTLDDLLTLAGDLGVPKVRDLGLLDSAAHRPRSGVFGQDAYPTLHEKAAVLLESLARNNPLVDGNKRLAWRAAFTFYGLNGVDLDAPEDDAYDLVIDVSTGAVDYGVAASRFEVWTRPDVVDPRDPDSSVGAGP